MLQSRKAQRMFQLINVTTIVALVVTLTATTALVLDQNTLFNTFMVDPDDTFVALSMADLTDISPDAFDAMNQLYAISLYANTLVQLDPVTFAPLVDTLIYLDLSSNQLGPSLDPRLFARQHNLIYLYLSTNRLELLDESTFRDCTALGSLDLARNRLARLEPRTFHGLEQLFDLDLSSNLLVEIDPLLFAQASSLEWLSLAYNRIQRIDRQAFKVGFSFKIL